MFTERRGTKLASTTDYRNICKETVHYMCTSDLFRCLRRAINSSVSTTTLVTLSLTELPSLSRSYKLLTMNKYFFQQGTSGLAPTDNKNSTRCIWPNQYK